MIIKALYKCTDTLLYILRSLDTTRNLMKQRLDRYVSGGTHPSNIWTGDTIRVSLLHFLGVKPSRLYLLISWHFVSPKRVFYAKVDKLESSKVNLTFTASKDAACRDYVNNQNDKWI